MNRKLRREIQKKVDKVATEQMAEQISQFGKLPDKCSACHGAFDKQDKEMVQSWKVVARQEVIRLFCPTCIKKTEEAIDKWQSKD